MNELQEKLNKKEVDFVDKVFRELREINPIALYKEEDEVIRKVMRGTTKKDILSYLNEKYKKDGVNFTYDDLNKFFKDFREPLLKKKTDVEKGYIRRMIKSKEGVNNELIDLALKAKKMIDRYDEQGDNTNAISALKASSDILMKFAKVEGLTQDNSEININMQMDKVVNKITEQSTNVSPRLKDLLDDDKEVIDGEYEVNND